MKKETRKRIPSLIEPDLAKGLEPDPSSPSER
jgi:hypothetical protein